MPSQQIKERPILFSGPMIRSILNGSKSQTRRIVKAQPPEDTAPITVGRYEPTVVDRHGEEQPGQEIFGAYDEDGEWGVKCPYGQPGDRLWVREAWADTNGENGPMVSYRAGGDRFLVDDSYPVEYNRYPGGKFTMWCGDLRRGAAGHGWKPSIHMPRWASRLTLEIVSVRLERLQEISREDAIAEGIGAWDPMGWPNYLHPERRTSSPVQTYETLWESINGPGSWAKNEWVWVVEFKRVTEGAPQ